MCLLSSNQDKLVAMCLLLVFVLLFSSSAYCSASSHQYYVSDNCSSVTYTPCHPLSVYARNMSQYNNTIFYFVGTSYRKGYNIEMNAVENITLQGLDQSSLISCNIKYAIRLLITYSSHITFSNLSLYHCRLDAKDSNNITVTGSFLTMPPIGIKFYGLWFVNVFDVKVLSSVLKDTGVHMNYSVPSICHNELHHYSLTMSNVTLFGNGIELAFFHSASYNLSVVLEHVNISNVSTDNGIDLYLSHSYFSLAIIKSAVYNTFIGINVHITNTIWGLNTSCDIHGVQLFPTILIEDGQLYSNTFGLRIAQNCGNSYSNIIIKSCSIYGNKETGLCIASRLQTSTNISIMNTELAGNAKNELIYCHSILLSNVNITNSLSTGLILRGSTVIVNNSLILRNNTGVVGGGMVLNDTSIILLAPQTSLEVINNHASYKGGGIYSDMPVSTNYGQILPQYPNHDYMDLIFWNNTVGVAGDDMYGVQEYECTLTSPNLTISSSGDAVALHFCNPKNTGETILRDTFILESPEQYIFPGQRLKFNVIALGKSYEQINNVTDVTVKIFLDDVLVNHTYITSKCSLVEYTPNQQTYGRHSIILSVHPYIGINIKRNYFTLYECPIGFSIDSSQGVCSCSQSVSRENITCDIASLNITHNGLQWIGTYDTSTPFNANQTNPNACIINEDCLLYCSPNRATFKMNDTDPQCVDNRGQRMCGSCRDGYSLLIGSNKCGHCDNDYMMIAWIALFVVMGLLLVVLLIALNLTVSVGTLNGLLFYANIVKLYQPVFSRKGALPVLSQVISWINLDFGIETCFYNGMDSYVKQWLQFAFPLYLWGIIILIIWLCRRYGKISRLMGSHAVPVLSTLFLLSYTKLVRTIVIVLHKREVTLHCTNESMRSVNLWYEDPNVEYAKGKHAGLFGFALFVSVFFILPYTLFLLFDPLYEKYLSNYKVFKKLWSKIKPIIDAYSGPMKDEYRFWPGLLLVARLPILLSVTLVDSFIQSHSFLLSMLLTVLAIVLSIGYCFGGVYRKRMNTIIEIWFLFNLCIMVGLSVAYNDDSAVLIWYNTCLSVFIVSFVAIVAYHLYLQLSHMKCYDALMKKLFKKQDDSDDEPLLDITEIHKTVDQQMREIKPSSTDIWLSHESCADLH